MSIKSYLNLLGAKEAIDAYIAQMNQQNNQEILSEVYKYVKSKMHIFYKHNHVVDDYHGIVNDIIFLERKFKNEKLLNIKIDFNLMDKKDNFIEYVVWRARQFLVNRHTENGYYDIDINDLNFSNDCRRASRYVKQICDEYKVECFVLPIYPGYSEKVRLYDGSGFHFANIIRYKNKYYLIDITYPQFFYKVRNNLDRLGVVDLSGCCAGIFMLMSDKGKIIANTLLQEGYIELNEEILKTYLDSFTVSFRNGLYYEKTNDFSYTTDYTIDDYIKFLSGEDSQVKHEGEKYLGFQKRPLKKWNLDFKK